MSDINRERANAVRGAWINERALVTEGKGTRDWSQRQQIGMIRKGQVTGIYGHHMQSVKTHPQQAGNPQNIQFLNKSEHIKGAHGGNTKFSTNGYYNPQTKTMQNFGNRSPQAPQMQISKPLSQNQINSAVKREQTYQNRVTMDTAMANQWRQAHGHSHMRRQKNHYKSIEAIQQKSSLKQSGTNATQTNRSANQVIRSSYGKNGQATNASKGTSSVAAKGASSGKSSGSSSGGKSSGGGKSR